MYTSKTITRSDGSKYVQVTSTIEPQPTTKEQDLLQRAIDQFGTSSLRIQISLDNINVTNKNNNMKYDLPSRKVRRILRIINKRVRRFY